MRMKALRETKSPPIAHGRSTFAVAPLASRAFAKCRSSSQPPLQLKPQELLLFVQGSSEKAN